MDPGLRRAWTRIVTADDYDAHMSAVGQAQAAADLTRWLLLSSAPAPGSHVVFAGAGTGQMLDFLDPDLLRPYRLTFADLNSAFLDRLRERLARSGLAAETVVDDIENTALARGPALLIATLLLEHVDWRRGADALAALDPASCGVILQENPPGMATAVTPGRTLPPSIARAVEIAHPVLVPCEELVAFLAARAYARRDSAARDVADGKRLVALRFAR